MFVLCPWSSPLTGSCRDARPTDAPPRVNGFIRGWDADVWSGDPSALSWWYSSYPEKPLPSAPFYPPLLFEPEEVLDEPSGGVDIESPELRLAQLSSLVLGCPWPFLTDSSEFQMRLSGECRVAALHLIESCLSIPSHMSEFVRIRMRTLAQGPKHPNDVETFIAEYGTDNGAGWRRVLKPKNTTQQQQQHISSSLCDLLARTLPGAFRVAYGITHFAPYQELIMAPIAPGWVLAMVGGGSKHY